MKYFTVLLMLVVANIASYSQTSEFDEVCFSIKPDFYAMNEDGVNIAYRFYENIINLKNGLINYNALSYDGYQRYPDKYRIEKTDKLLVMYDYNSIKNNNKNYSGHKVIRIPQKVEFEGKFYTVISICHRAFYKCKDVEEIILPNTIETIYVGAFSFCQNLRHVKFPEKIKFLDNFLFEESNSIEYVSFPSLKDANFTTVKGFVLDRNKSIKEIEIDSTWQNMHVLALNYSISGKFKREHFYHKSEREINQMVVDFDGCYPFDIRYRE